MYIHNLPNETKETIFKKVYERQCYEVVLSQKPIGAFFHMLWFYDNPLAHSIVWKWLIWYTQPTLYSEQVRWVKSNVYDRFYNSIHKAHRIMYTETKKNPVTLEKEWYNIETIIPPQLKTFLKKKNKLQISKEILSIHPHPINISHRQRRQLIVGFRQRLPAFIQLCCDGCGLGEGIITYPCKHRCCVRCFEGRVIQHCFECHILNLDSDKTCDENLKRKGWNYYISKYLGHLDVKRCRKCGYLRCSHFQYCSCVPILPVR